MVCVGAMGCDAGTEFSGVAQQQAHSEQQEVSGLFAVTTSAVKTVCIAISKTLNSAANVVFKAFKGVAYFFAFFSAASIFFMYLAGSLSKSFLQSLQHILISWPL